MSVDLRVDWCSYQAAKYAVEHWHYSKAMPTPPAHYIGVWENAAFVGCVIFGRGSNNNRYLYPLDRAMRRQIAPLAQPYPKRETCGPSVEGDTPPQAESVVRSNGAASELPR